MKTVSLVTALLVGLGSAAMAQDGGGRRPGGPGGQGGPGRPGGPGGMMRMMPVMVALDADKNGEISGREIDGAPAALKTLDKNSDGKLTLEELRPAGGRPGGPGGNAQGRPGGGRPGEGGQRGPGEAGARPGGEGRRGPGGPGGPGGEGRRGGMMRMAPVLVALDADHDSEISAKEIANSPAALKTLDKNTDGKLTQDEFRPNFGPGGPGGPGGRPGGRPGGGERPNRPGQQ